MEKVNVTAFLIAVLCLSLNYSIGANAQMGPGMMGRWNRMGNWGFSLEWRTYLFHGDK